MPESIEFLDIDCNKIDTYPFNELVFPYLPNLLALSLRENLIEYGTNEKGQRIGVIAKEKIKLVLNSPKLKLLDVFYSNIEKIVFQTPLGNPKELKLIDNNDEDEGYFSDEDNEFSQKHKDSPTRFEQIVLENQQQREREVRTRQTYLSRSSLLRPF